MASGLAGAHPTAATCPGTGLREQPIGWTSAPAAPDNSSAGRATVAPDAFPIRNLKLLKSYGVVATVAPFGGVSSNRSHPVTHVYQIVQVFTEIGMPEQSHALK